MTAAAPWSVKGIDPKAREVAKDLARRSGMTLGEWLNRMIIEGEGQGGDASGAPSSGSQDRSAHSYLHIASNSDSPPRIEIADHPADEVGRVALALDRLAGRIEAAEGRSAAAISGIDQSVREALTRLGLSEREQIAVAARFEGAVDDLKTEQARTAERLRRMEAEATGPRSAEALRALEGALGKVAGHLYDGEARTRDAIAALEARLDAQSPAAVDPTLVVNEVVARLGERLEAAETRTTEALRELGASFSVLDSRLKAVEGDSPTSGVQERLEQLAGDLTQRMDAARLEMAARLRDSADGRFDRMEQTLGEMAGHVQAAEQRSTQAIERMGREVVSVAEAFNRRLQSAESRSAAAIEQVGGEVARIASSVEQRLNRADSVQGQALEKLGAEIARITEKLAERINSAERRNALAIDDVGEQVTRVTDRLNQRHERSSQELVDRIRQSEERTARMLEEAREKIDARLSEAQRKLAEPVAPEPQPAPAPALITRPSASPFATTSYSFGGERSAEAPSSAFEAEAFPAVETEPPGFYDDDYEAADGFLDQEPSDDFEGLEPAADFSAFPGGGSEPERPLSTREVIEQARAAARAATAAAVIDAKAKKDSEKAAKAKSARPSLFSGFGKPSAKPAKRRVGSSLTNWAIIVGAAGAVGAGVAGLLLPSHSGGRAPEQVAQVIADQPPGVSVKIAPSDALPGTVRAAVALAPQWVEPANAVSAAPEENAQAVFEDGVRKVEIKDRSGVEAIRRAASLGLPQAQFYLSKMYEMGEGGVDKDLPEARRWTERAANGGDPRAMHNLALFYFKGQGGPKNSAMAATWFRKAADHGLVDSQFNLAQLYEGGWGVSQSPVEAYKWYMIAGRAGDVTSKARAAALRSRLTVETQRAAERSAFAFQAQAATPAVEAQATKASPVRANIGLAQRVLSQLGYYQGPRDGAASPALQMAISAYQRDQGLQASGALDTDTQSRLSVYAR